MAELDALARRRVVRVPLQLQHEYRRQLGEARALRRSDARVAGGAVPRVAAVECLGCDARGDRVLDRRDPLDAQRHIREGLRTRARVATLVASEGRLEAPAEEPLLERHAKLGEAIEEDSAELLHVVLLVNVGAPPTEGCDERLHVNRPLARALHAGKEEPKLQRDAELRRAMHRRVVPEGVQRRPDVVEREEALQQRVQVTRRAHVEDPREWLRAGRASPPVGIAPLGPCLGSMLLQQRTPQEGGVERVVQRRARARQPLLQPRLPRAARLSGGRGGLHLGRGF